MLIWSKCIIHSPSPENPLVEISIYILRSRKTSNRAPSNNVRMCGSWRITNTFFRSHPLPKRLRLHRADGAVNAYLMNVGVIFGLHVVHMGVEWSERWNFIPSLPLKRFLMRILLQRYAYERDRMSVTRSGSRQTFGDALFYYIWSARTAATACLRGCYTRGAYDNG